jgi:hypothetical protein
MMIALLLTLAPAQAQEVLGGSDLIVTVTVGLTGKILLDGQETGVTAPGLLSGVSAGEHQVQVRGECLLGMGFVTVIPGHLARIEVDLQTTGGFVEVNVVPLTAAIIIDGERVGTGPSLGTELSCGEHRVEAREEGLEPQSRDIVVEMGTAQTLTIDLTVARLPLPPAELPLGKDYTAVRRGVGLGLAILGAGGIGTGVWLQRKAQLDYRETYVPEFEACGDLACQEQVQDYRSENIARAYYGSMIVAGAGLAILTTAGIVGLTSDGVPILGVTHRW